jgi:hypothetical protein
MYDSSTNIEFAQGVGVPDIHINIGQSPLDFLRGGLIQGRVLQPADQLMQCFRSSGKVSFEKRQSGSVFFVRIYDVEASVLDPFEKIRLVRLQLIDVFS